MSKAVLGLVAPAIATLALAAPAVAAPSGEERMSVEVRYSDLDLTRADHVATFIRRIEQAARRVCDTSYIRDLKAMAAFRECVAEARLEAQRQIAAKHLPVEVVLAGR